MARRSVATLDGGTWQATAMADRDSRSGKSYLTEEISSYASQVHASHDAAAEQAFAAPTSHGMPAIMLGPLEAKFLTVCMHMIGAEKVVEVGTLAGYSAIMLARGMAPSGKVWTVEFDPTHAEIARSNIAAAGYGDRIEVLVGPALEVLPTLEAHGPFDAVFIDADKENYPGYGDWSTANLRSGGLLLADNAFVFGGLMSDTAAGQNMRRFHENTAAHYHSTCVPTPDGMVMAVKK